jgi:hypothetical protein
MAHAGRAIGALPAGKPAGTRRAVIGDCANMGRGDRGFTGGQARRHTPSGDRCLREYGAGESVLGANMGRGDRELARPIFPAARHLRCFRAACAIHHPPRCCAAAFLRRNRHTRGGAIGVLPAGKPAGTRRVNAGPGKPGMRGSPYGVAIAWMTPRKWLPRRPRRGGSENGRQSIPKPWLRPVASLIGNRRLGGPPRRGRRGNKLRA